MENRPFFPDLLEKHHRSFKFVLSGLLLFGSGLLLAKTWEYRKRPQLSYYENAVSNESQSPSSVEKSSSPTSPSVIKIDISGAVRKPGVYSLEPDDRVEDALRKAGGLVEDTDRQWVSRELNLASKLSDGDKLYIPAKGEVQRGLGEATVVSGRGDIAGETVQESGCPTKININTASLETLTCLYNIGEKRAQAIMDYRSQKPFGSVEEITSIKGIGEKTLEKIRDKVVVR